MTLNHSIELQVNTQSGGGLCMRMHVSFYMKEALKPFLIFKEMEYLVISRRNLMAFSDQYEVRILNFNLLFYKH